MPCRLPCFHMFPYPSPRYTIGCGSTVQIVHVCMSVGSRVAGLGRLGLLAVGMLVGDSAHQHAV